MSVVCEKCLELESQCLCAQLEKIETVPTRLKVLILQHPQEPEHDLGTAHLVQRILPKAQVRVGLSWPNLKAALGVQEVQSARWVVLYLGSGVKGDAGAVEDRDAVLQFVSRQGNRVSEPPRDQVEGIVVLDGTWSQAKALWWRNAWLLKLKRAILSPKQKSLYGALRKEPRRECLSTLESVGESLVALGEPPEVNEKLISLFRMFLDNRQKSKPRRR